MVAANRFGHNVFEVNDCCRGNDKLSDVGIGRHVEASILMLLVEILGSSFVDFSYLTEDTI